MYRNILVPVDLSDQNAAAIALAGRLVDRASGSVTLLHVIETLDLPFEEMHDFYEQLADQAREKLESMGRVAREEGVQLRFQTTYGRRVRSILEHIEDHEVDLVVMNSHRLDPTQENAGWMTISYQVSFFARCSVLLLR